MHKQFLTIYLYFEYFYRYLRYYLKTPLISIIIPAFNSELTIKRCISSIKSQKYPKENYEIIVVDDESSDNTVNIAKNAGADKVITIQHSSSGAARNTGSKHASGKILSFIDSDCIAQNGWLQTIEKEFEKNQVIGGPILNGTPNSVVAWAEYLMEFSDFNEHKNRSFVNFVPACNQACTKEVFETNLDSTRVNHPKFAPRSNTDIPGFTIFFIILVIDGSISPVSTGILVVLPFFSLNPCTSYVKSESITFLTT